MAAVTRPRESRTRRAAGDRVRLSAMTTFTMMVARVARWRWPSSGAA
jgi:hypothetical protein